MFSEKFLITILGRQWKRKLLFLLIWGSILILIPNIIFFRKVKFNPASFTQEWVRTVINLFFIFLIIEYQKYSSENNRKKAVFLDYVNLNIVIPMQEILILYKHPNPAIDVLKTSWQNIFKTIDKFDANTFQLSKVDKVVLSVKTDCNLPFINSYIISLDRSSLSRKDEYDKCLQGLECLLFSFEKTRDYV